MVLDAPVGLTLLFIKKNQVVKNLKKNMTTFKPVPQKKFGGKRK